MDEKTVITLSFALMFGALIGWLAPAAVSLGLIGAVLLTYYWPAVWDPEPKPVYGATVRVMMRRW